MRFVPRSLRTIAWDVDDVLNDLMMGWFEQQWLECHKDCKLRYEDITENPPHKVLGIGRDEYLKSLDNYRLSPSYQQLSPTKEIKEWFVKNGEKYRHIALTAVPLIAAPASSQWIFKHFGIWIRTFHFVPSKREEYHIPDYDKDKTSFLKWLSKVDVFVDDSPENINAAESIGIKGILWKRPWNNSKLKPSEALALLDSYLG